ncbi:MAG: thiamine-binding protein [Clostridia bacterium]|nr:thiamine-binding protein [Clostridia bacterium]MBQ3077109.1 thiamine-binding protein [Clostridia bacterium]
MNASFAIQLLPSVEREKLLPVVDEVIAYIQSHGLKTVVGPFETVIEGDFDQLIEILRGCCKVCVEAGAPSLMSYVKISYNPGGDGFLTIADKIDKYSK